ncbi:related to TFIID subunit TAF19 [Cephalotrichum gorgonifer]|uniref:Transcription initiation factor TFIID subunit 13 n=1 Tax=Cephalotrichum gorgonifer TaxID=2041049 RepID=A0AAE8SYB7_9PEZI|nr:related to TFIID subunit TAF19 [Cephalotrichum gorgonifer]
MEPRARAGKNVGKSNFSVSELSVLLFAHGDVFAPLPETVRVLDDILSDFIQGVAFEANRAAHHAGRQKIKAEDFQFAFRKNPTYLGKIQEVLEKKADIESARKIFKDNEGEFAKDVVDMVAEEDQSVRSKSGRGRGGGSTSGKGRVEEELLGEEDDDAEAEADILRKS